MPTVFVDRVAFKTDLGKSSVAEALTAMQTAGQQVRLMRARLEDAFRNGSGLQQAEAIASALSSPEARLWCSVRAAKKLRVAKRPSLEACLQLPSTLDLTKPLPQSVPVYAKPKSGGRFRMIHKPGHAHRTAQELVVLALAPAFIPRPFQHTHRGVHDAARAVRAAIETGHVYCAHLDIKSYFASFELEKLAPELPLPLEWVEHAVIGRHWKVTWDQDRYGAKPPHLLPPNHLLLEARLGLPLGATSSPLVGMHCISHLAWTITPGVVLVNYADDFLLLATSSELLEQAVGTLQKAVSKLPGGSFVLTVRETRKATSGIDFLGHHFRLANGEVAISPSYGNLQDFYRRLDRIAEKLTKLVLGPPLKDPEQGAKLLAKLAALICGWAAAFRLCDRLPGYLREPNEILAEYMSQLRVSAEDVASSVERADKYEWIGGTSSGG